MIEFVSQLLGNGLSGTWTAVTNAIEDFFDDLF
jgi:Flp pilus assembly pilin Flp